jgi:hypothetical protein
MLHGDSVEKIHLDAVFPVLNGKNGEDGIWNLRSGQCARLCGTTCKSFKLALTL